MNTIPEMGEEYCLLMTLRLQVNKIIMKRILILLILITISMNSFSQPRPIPPFLLRTRTLSVKDWISRDITAIINETARLPNNQLMWNKVQQKVYGYLYQKFYDGTLKGSKADQAFFIMIGTQSMTQEDINQGKLIVVVGIALLKPAEFELLRFEKQL